MVGEDIKQAPFNMALYTLESIRKWIDKIAELSVGIISGVKINNNELIVLKQKMVKQLIMLTTPLLNPEELKKIQISFKNIKIKTGRIKVSSGWMDNAPIYTKEIDYQLDDNVQEIETALQDSGHFMPSGDESSLF